MSMAVTCLRALPSFQQYVCSPSTCAGQYILPSTLCSLALLIIVFNAIFKSTADANMTFAKKI